MLKISNLLRYRPVIVGDNKGQLLEVVLDEKEKRDPPVKALYSFEDAPAPITGLQQHLAQQKILVLVATVSRLYVFVGGKDLEPLFTAYPESAGDTNLASLRRVYNRDPSLPEFTAKIKPKMFYSTVHDFETCTL